MALHVADLDDLAGAVARGDDPVDVGDAEADRLLAEDVQAGVERRQHDLEVRARRRRDQDCVERRRCRRASASRRARRDRVACGERLAHRLRRLRERREPELAGELREVREVHRLGDEAAADDADPSLTIPVAGHVVRIMVRSRRSLQVRGGRSQMEHLERPITRRGLLKAGAVSAAGLYAAGTLGRAGRAAGATRVSAGGVTMNWLTWSDHFLTKPNQLGAVKKLTGITGRPQLFSDDSDSYVKVKAGGGGWDMSSEDALWVPKFYNEGLIVAFDIKSFPVSKQLYSVALDVPFWKAGSNQMGYPFGWSSLQIYYNPKYVTTKPDSYHALLEQELQEEDRPREPADRPDGDGRPRDGREEAVRHDDGRDREREGVPQAAQAERAQARLAEHRGRAGADRRHGVADDREHRHGRTRQGRGRPDHPRRPTRRKGCTAGWTPRCC